MSLYKLDLFISYAHIDNQPVCETLPGWISRFHEALNTLLSMHLGKQVRIWRDDKLQGNDHFAEEIVNRFNSTAALITVLTPRYLHSEWCTREVREFCDSVDDRLFVDNKARVFKIVKTPVDSEESLPNVMQDVLGYDFYIHDDGIPMVLDSAYGSQYGQGFNRQINKLAFEIADLLKTLKANTPVSSENSIPVSNKHQNVYLAECSYDVKQARDALATQLHAWGYHVLPDRRLPRDTEQTYIDAVNSLLEECDVSVHLVGQQYGAVLDGPSDESVACVQNRLAAEHSEHSSLKRLIWTDKSDACIDQKQTDFIDNLENDASFQLGADLLQDDFEELKTCLKHLLENTKVQTEQAQNQQVEDKPEEHPASHQNTLFLICTEADRKPSLGLRKYLRAHGITTVLPAFTGDAAQVRKINHDSMTTCNTLMLYYGEGEETWKRSMDIELRKLPGYLKGKPMPKILTYIDAPQTNDKIDLVDMEEPGVIDGTDGIQTEALDTFFDLSDKKIHLV